MFKVHKQWFACILPSCLSRRSQLATNMSTAPFNKADGFLPAPQHACKLFNFNQRCTKTPWTKNRLIHFCLPATNFINVHPQLTYTAFWQLWPSQCSATFSLNSVAILTALHLNERFTKILYATPWLSFTLPRCCSPTPELNVQLNWSLQVTWAIFNTISPTILMSEVLIHTNSVDNILYFIDTIAEVLNLQHSERHGNYFVHYSKCPLRRTWFSFIFGCEKQWVNKMFLVCHIL